MKIGGSQPQSAYRLADPDAFAPRTVSEDLQNGKSWKNLTLRVAAPNSRVWFSEYASVPFRDWLVKHQQWDPNGVDNLLRDFEHLELDQHEVFPQFLRTPDDVGEAVIPLTESALANKVLADLAQRGVTGDFTKVVAAGGMILALDLPVEWLGAWGTINGSRCFVRFEARRDATGRERIVFHTTLLVSTRAITQELTSELQASVVLGFWAQTLMYVAENPLPSIVSFSRDLALQDVPSESRPMPLIWLEPFGLTLTEFPGGTAGQVPIDTASYPLVLNVGFVIEDSQHISQAIAHSIDALVASASIVEDGFRNMRNEDSVIAFDQVFASESDLMDNPIGEVRGHARWIPEPLLGQLKSLTTENYTLVTQGVGTSAEQRAALQWIADNGAGQFTASAINTLAYSYLIPEQSNDRAEFYLQQAIGMDVMDESTNAMANLGSLYLQMGRHEDGVQILLQALERSDKFAEGEASLLLGRAYQAIGDRSRAVTFFERAAAADDRQFAEEARRELGGTQPTPTTPTATTLPKFCGDCGVQFPNAAAKFCGNCGNQRRN